MPNPVKIPDATPAEAGPVDLAAAAVGVAGPRRVRMTAAGRAVAEAADAPAQRSALGLGPLATYTFPLPEPPDNAQLALVSIDAVWSLVALDSGWLTDAGATGRALFQAADAATGRAVLGLDSMAVQSAGSVNITGGAISGARLRLAGAPGSPLARDLYAVGDTLRYRDSANAERTLLNAADNLANLSNVATARANLGLAAVAASGSASDLGTGTLPAARLPASGATAGTFRSVTVDTAGRVTAGTNPTTLAGYGITDAAPLASPALTGIPTAPTAAGGTNTTQVATTAFVQAAVGGVSAPVTSVATKTGAVSLASTDLTDGTATGRSVFTAASAAAARSAVGLGTWFVPASSGTLLGLTAQAATDTPLDVTAAASQTADLTRWRNSSGTTVLSVSAPTGGEPAVWLKGMGTNALGFRSNAVLQFGNNVYQTTFNQFCNFGEVTSTTGGIWRNSSTQYVLFNGNTLTTDITGLRTTRVLATDTAYPTLVVRCIASQTANAVEVQDSGSSVVARVTAGGGVSANGPLTPGVYTFATLPSASANSGGVVRVSDRSGVLVYSDGTNWKKFSDNTTLT